METQKKENLNITFTFHTYQTYQTWDSFCLQDTLRHFGLDLSRHHVQSLTISHRFLSLSLSCNRISQRYGSRFVVNLLGNYWGIIGWGGQFRCLYS